METNIKYSTYVLLKYEKIFPDSKICTIVEQCTYRKHLEVLRRGWTITHSRFNSFSSTLQWVELDDTCGFTQPHNSLIL